MPKGNLNPADAYRKAQRKKELKKNKAGRAKARDFALVKKDTTELEEEINQLQSTNGDKARLTELKTELGKINKKKEEYVKEHPEKRNLVYRRYRKQADDNTTAQPDKLPKRNLFNEQGMPYLERLGSGADNEDAPAPPAGYELVESDDEIFLPEGPPPIKDGSMQPLSLAQQSLSYQAHRFNQYTPPYIPPPNSSLANATVVVAPQLRDFKKEATAFLPNSLKKKKPGPGTTQVNTAPPLEPSAPVNEGQTGETKSHEPVHAQIL